jgi:molecular chaperone Hsp33
MISADMKDPVLAERLGKLQPDGITIFTLGDGAAKESGGAEAGLGRAEVRGAIIHGTRLVNQMRANHGLGILETYILGEAYLGALLMASGLKDGDRLGIRLDCEGPAQGFSVEGRAGRPGSGANRDLVRGYLFNAAIPVERELSSFDTSPFFGKGSLTVTRFSGGAQRPFTGTVALRSGRLAEDLAVYYLESEQTRTALDLGIHFDREGRVAGAGGIFLQALPGAREGFVAQVEAALVGSPSVGLWFAEGKAGQDLLRQSFGNLGLALLEEREAAFSCDCSRERFAAFLAASDDGLLRELCTQGPWPVVANCHNCSSSYGFSRGELLAMARARGLSVD